MNTSGIGALKPLALLSLFCLCTSLSAQTGSINGKITDNSSKQSLPGVAVYLKGTNTGVISDGQGNYELRDIQYGTYTLIVRSMGYETQNLQVTISDSVPLIQHFELIEKLTELSTVTVRGVTLTGGIDDIHRIPGSAHYISPRELAKFNYTDINRVLNNVPGVNIQEEEGFGLRPNIGMRGTGVERSAKITLMEDGILVAPAPYAAPAAYYFPTIGRMRGIEIRKGSSQIKYGPYTTGGAINFLSSQIPKEFRGIVNLQAGSFDQRSLHANVGQSSDNLGFLIETFQSGSDGFKTLDSGDDTGFNQEDYLAKFRLNTSQNASVYQALTLKIAQSTGESNETYLGLTEQDFEKDAFRRYAASQQDLMETEQTQFSAQHVIQPLKFMDITSTFYRNDFKRNWYKLDKVKSAFGTAGISTILGEPELFPTQYQTISGFGPDTLLVKANNRKYFSQGFQSLIGLNLDGEKNQHDIEIGFRFHKDEMDRFQWVDDYVMNNGVMQLINQGIPGTESNRIQSAKAFASFIQYIGVIGRLQITPGFRYESISLTRKDFGKNDTNRFGTDLNTQENKVDVLIPGIGLDYRPTEKMSVFMGIHKGFAPPSSTEGSKPERSINYELGLRYQTPAIRFNGVFYVNDYSNLLGSDLAAAGGTGVGDQFNGGESLVQGAEIELGYEILHGTNSKFGLPLSIAYTYTNAEFRNSFESDFDAWGSVSPGDQLPYLANHRLSINMSLEHSKFNVNLNTNYVAGMRTVAGQGDLSLGEHIDERLIADISANIHLSPNLTLTGTINNVTDKGYLVSTRPAGLRPGISRNFKVGLSATF